MSALHEKMGYVQSLERILNRLGASDLTVAESMELHPQLLELLGEIEAAGPSNWGRSHEPMARAEKGPREPRRGGCVVC